MPGLLTKAYWNVFTVWNARHETDLPFWPPEKIEEVQNRRLRRMVAHAYREVPYYREVMEERGLRPGDFQTAADLARLPLLEGKEVAAAPERFQARGYREKAVSLVSSGTSGRAKTIRFDRAALFLSLAHGHRQRVVLRQFAGRSFGYREMLLTRRHGVSSQLRAFYENYSWTPRRIDFQRERLRDLGVTIEEQVEQMNRFRPDVVRGYGAYVGSVFRMAVERGLEIARPKAIVYGAEPMPEADKALIEERLGVPVLSTYQTVEALRIGFQCERREGFHIHTDAVAFRVVDEEGNDVAPGQRGHMVISNLTNRATVILNYKLGDVVTLGAGGCPCGRTLPTIERIEGRSEDSIVLPGGGVMHGLLVHEGLREAPGIIQIQLVQEELDRFLLRVVGKREADRPAAEQALRQALRRAVGESAAVRVEWMAAIPPGPGGKVKAVECRPARPPAKKTWP